MSDRFSGPNRLIDAERMTHRRIGAGYSNEVGANHRCLQQAGVHTPKAQALVNQCHRGERLCQPTTILGELSTNQTEFIQTSENIIDCPRVHDVPESVIQCLYQLTLIFVWAEAKA